MSIMEADLIAALDAPEDQDLLVLAERGLLLMQQVREHYDFWPRGQGPAVSAAHHKRLKQFEHETKTVLRAMGKLRAQTPAGVYAKAQLVMKSRTGAAVLAKSLATDMISLPGLRQVLWPARGVQ